MSHLTQVAEQVARSRYFMKDKQGNCIEDWEGLSHRVVNHVCKKEDQSFKDEMYEIILNTQFLPNSPCLVNAGRGTKSRGLLACFVTKAPEDSWVGMIENIANYGHVCRQGGGCGVSLSNIRPEGDPVFGSTHAKACGPIEHMRMVSEVMHSITQSGFRSMACMATLSIKHPDIKKFIACKQRERALKTLLHDDISGHLNKLQGKTHDHLNLILDKFISNFNISVVATDDFMEKVAADEDFDLEFNGKIYETIKAKDLFDFIVYNAWKNGDPGFLFYDTMNSGPYKYSKQWIDATNPCGEQVLPNWGSCNLGSIDVSKFFNESSENMDWKQLRRVIHAVFQFLDDVIDINMFPTPDFEKWARQNRPVGLGIMGFADLLLKKKIAYGSKESIEFADKLSSFFEKESHAKSVELGKERGTPKCCKFDELEHRRNVTTVSIAPTGTISLLAGCSSSIEPVFSPVTYRTDNTGSYKMPHTYAKRSYFRCAVDPEKKKEVTWQEHIEIQAAFQKHVDSAISKTINMPNSATQTEVAEAFMMAHKSGCKGITIYRDGCKSVQVLNTSDRLGSTHARKRPRLLDCDIHKTRADGYDWHIMIGKYENVPYELFAVNGRVALPSQGRIIKRKKHHYSLVDEDNNVLIENLAQEEEQIDPKISLETRRFSLELRHGIHPKFIAQQVDRSNDYLNSFSKATARIIKKHYMTNADHIAIADDIVCPSCAEKGKTTEMICQAGCWACPAPECGYAKCG